MRTGERGFTYLGLIFALAIGAGVMAAAAPRWQVLAQRERETELIFRGDEIRRALASYQAATPAGAADAPQELQALLVDARHTPARHHLRRLYTDPFTGRADWQLLRNERGGIVGVRSRSEVVALRHIGVPVQAGSASAPRVGDWWFTVGAISTPLPGN